MNFGSAGTASTSYLAGEIFKQIAKVNLVHVPYKGAPEALTSIMRNDTQVYFASTTYSPDLITSKKIKVLAVSSAKRAPRLPDVPTAAESGLPDYVYDSWFGVMAPAGTPAAILNKVSRRHRGGAEAAGRREGGRQPGSRGGDADARRIRQADRVGSGPLRQDPARGRRRQREINSGCTPSEVSVLASLWMLPRPAYLRSAISVTSRKPFPTAPRCCGPAAGRPRTGSTTTPSVLIDRSDYSDCTPANFARGMRDAAAGRYDVIVAYLPLYSPWHPRNGAALAARRPAASVGVVHARPRRVLAAADKAFRSARRRRPQRSLRHPAPELLPARQGRRRVQARAAGGSLADARRYGASGAADAAHPLRPALAGAARKDPSDLAAGAARRHRVAGGRGRFRRRPPTSFSAATPRRIRGCGEPASWR